MTEHFTPPPISTKVDLGKVELVASFIVDLQLGPKVLMRTPHGQRMHQKILGGTITGPRLSGAVYQNGGGEFGLIRDDGVEEIFTRFMIIADNGEWLYTHANGYKRTDGYSRFQGIFDADVQGPHAWLNENMFIGRFDCLANGTRRRMAYFEAA